MHVDVRRAYSARCRPPLLPTVAVGIAVDCQPPCFTSGSGVQVERRYELASVNSGAGDERTAQQRRRRGRQTPFLCALAHFFSPAPNSVPHVVHAGSCWQKMDRQAEQTNLQEDGEQVRSTCILLPPRGHCAVPRRTLSPRPRSINPVNQSSQSIRSHPRSMGRLWQKQEARKSTRAVPGRRR